MKRRSLYVPRRQLFPFQLQCVKDKRSFHRFIKCARSENNRKGLCVMPENCPQEDFTPLSIKGRQKCTINAEKSIIAPTEEWKTKVNAKDTESARLNRQLTVTQCKHRTALEHAVVAVGLIMVACLHNSYFVQLKPRFQMQVTQRKKTTPKMGKKRRPGPIKSITLYISEGGGR